MGVVALATYSHSLKTLIFYILQIQSTLFLQGTFLFRGIEIDYSFGSMDASSFALRISLLKFEPRVSNFPVLETDGTVSSTFATVKSHFYFDVSL